MSDAMYLFRVYFDNDKGSACVPGARRILTSPPSIPGLCLFDAIDFAPGCVAMIREPKRGWRDMEGDERNAARKWLDSMKDSV
jgi:hypothetical protein